MHHWFIKWCYIQLIMSFCSSAILVNWGLPFCPLSFLGNLIFSPVLFAFLFLATIIFFCELLTIPNGLLIWFIEKLTALWLWVLRLASSNAWLIPIKQPSPLYLAIFVTATFIIVLLHTTCEKKICYLIVLAICSLWSVQQIQPQKIEKLPCHNGELTIIKTSDKLAIIDPGVLGRRLSAPSFVEYTLLPHLIKNYGTQTIDHLVLLQPGKLLFEAVEHLIDKAIIKQIYYVDYK